MAEEKPDDRPSARTRLAAERQRLARQKATRRRTLIAMTALIIVVGGVFSGLALTRGNEDATTDASAAKNTCEYSRTPSTPSKDVQVPKYDAAAAALPYTADLNTNRGKISFESFSQKAPCASFSFKYLAQNKYYDNTPCHRLTTQGIHVLQCGDPGGSGSGGPGYSFPDENLAGATYPAGTVAMANSGPNTNGSQFFLVYQDSQLPPSYTPFGVISEGLEALRSVAAAGDDSSNGPGDGHPNQAVTIETVGIRQK
ncbi:peptidylprolyl isomerase [Kitasatospora sp. NPDC048540]|uniref:peptidylprolyl isomerase n=1 Tax=unclassified Kitasatospora TaxID=2633591 RepID=UPI0009EC442F|nr:peptidylprolyl isomerase [Kitasatospora sp. MBT63]